MRFAGRTVIADAGFAVTVLKDCCAAPNPDWHRFSIENILPLFGYRRRRNS
jgi:nicotinamidase-related amidase